MTFPWPGKISSVQRVVRLWLVLLNDESARQIRHCISREVRGAGTKWEYDKKYSTLPNSPWCLLV